MSTMVYKVVSTKLNEEEHEKFLEFCNKKGFTTSSFIKNAVTKMMESEDEEVFRVIPLDELRKELGIKK